jgi:hypothetical protein
MRNDWKNYFLKSRVKKPTMCGFMPIKLSFPLKAIESPFYEVIRYDSFTTQKACNHPKYSGEQPYPGAFQIKIQYGTHLMFVPCTIRLAKTTNTCTELYHSIIQYTGTHMFRQWSAIIRELLGFVWVTWNADRIGGIWCTFMWPVCRNVVVPSVVLPSWVHFHSAEKHNKRNHNTPAHRSHKHTLYTTYSICVSSN